jgi:hypothetical protein
VTRALSHAWRILSRAEEQEAAVVLGADHGLVRALAYRCSFARHVLVTAVPLLLGAAGVAMHVTVGRAVLEAAVVVQVSLLAALIVARGIVRDRAYELIADDENCAALPLIAHERCGLLSAGHRERLARSLERLIHSAQHWEEILPAFRPPDGVRCLRFMAPEAREIASLLRAGTTDARGVALAERFLAGGDASSLCRGDVVALREELKRVHYLLAASATAQDSRQAA